MSSHIKISSRKDRTRWRRKHSIRKRITGTAERPRLSVFRSNAHIYAQAIDDVSHKVLAAASDLEATIAAGLEASAPKKKKGETARLVGQAIGKKLKDLNVARVVFDRNGFVYHGRVKQVAEGAREAGLEF
jgi:large subunit ribosomal protein L18